ncbi:hypothetical protein DFH06DRAFT_601345 [Mycena polygramma]|nr:hypothetical protein DFH06DRAFT_601345 [Mycena polygramma]
MLNNSSGFQIYGNVCNAGGDMVIQNSPLTVRGADATAHPPALSMSGQGEVGLQPRLAIQSRESPDAASQPVAEAAFHTFQGLEREGTGVVRNARRIRVERPSPYNSTSHPIRHNEEIDVSPSSSSNALSSSHAFAGSKQTPHLGYPLPNVPLPQTHSRLEYPNLSLYPQPEYSFNDEETPNPSSSSSNSSVTPRSSVPCSNLTPISTMPCLSCIPTPAVRVHIRERETMLRSQARLIRQRIPLDLSPRMQLLTPRPIS